MKRSILSTLAFALLLAGATGFSAQAKGVSGAIFTTTFDGTVVNGNQYDSKCAVYLDGGPGPNAPAKAAGLPDGDYYFQVTDPSGEELLSTDPVSNRRFQVSGGVIVAYTGTGGPVHPTGMDQDHPELGAITIRLANMDCPTDFKNSPNNGGVYKVWATPVADYLGDPMNVDNDCGSGCFHGFLPSKSKTDNFKAQPSEPSFCLTLIKEFIEGGEPVREAEWGMTVIDSLPASRTYYTDENGEVRVCGLVPGSYTVVEETTNSEVVGLFFNGVEQIPPQPLYSFSWKVGDPEPVVLFQNEEGGLSLQ